MIVDYDINDYKANAPAGPTEAEIAALQEQLEQLRALSLGMTIRVGIPTTRPGAGVDTEDDLAVAAAQLRK